MQPPEWLFPGYSFSTPLTITGVQKAFTAAKRRAGIDKVGSIHALRHAYATHQLQRLLGQRSQISRASLNSWGFEAGGVNDRRA